MVDDQGQQTAVIIDIDEYRTLLAELREHEEEEDRWLVEVYNKAKAEPDAGAEPESFESVVAEIERERGWTTQ